MKNSAANSGSKNVTPNAFVGGQFGIRLDSRLKHAGMTDIELTIALTQQAARE